MSQSPQQPRGDDPSPPPAGLCDRYFISALGSRGANGLPKALKPHNDLSTWEIYFAICICKKRGRNKAAKLESCCFSLLLSIIHLLLLSRDWDGLSPTLRLNIFISGQMNKSERRLPDCYSTFPLIPLAPSPVLQLPLTYLTLTSLK